MAVLGSARWGKRWPKGLGQVALSCARRAVPRGGGGRREGGGRGVWHPKDCAPKKKMAQSDFPNGKFGFVPRWSLWSWGGGGPGRGTRPPRAVYGGCNTSVGGKGGMAGPLGSLSRVSHGPHREMVVLRSQSRPEVRKTSRTHTHVTRDPPTPHHLRVTKARAHTTAQPAATKAWRPGSAHTKQQRFTAQQVPRTSLACADRRCSSWGADRCAREAHRPRGAW